MRHQAGSTEVDAESQTADGAPRRLVLVGTGAVGLAGVLVACGGGAEQPAGGGGGGGDALAQKSDIPVGGGKIFKEQKVVVTQPAEGTFKAFSAVCTHQGCTVGSINGDIIQCPCHGSQYSIADGSVQGGPAPDPLPAEDITVEGDAIKLA